MLRSVSPQSVFSDIHQSASNIRPGHQIVKGMSERDVIEGTNNPKEIKEKITKHKTRLNEKKLQEINELHAKYLKYQRLFSTLNLK